ncbi:unnamed protein product, partial [Prunus brigantina]
MLEIGNKLKALKVNVDEIMMVHFAINSLPSTFKHLRSTYVAQKEKWTVTDLISICVQEEQNMKKDKTEEKINMVQNSFRRDFGKGKIVGKKNKEEKLTKELKPNGLKCYFCKKLGHMKRNCDKYKRWLDKQKAKGKTNQVHVCFESNAIEISSDSWWLDSGALVHVANSLQGFKTKRLPSKAKMKVFVGNGEGVKVEYIGLARIELESDFVLELVYVVYIPSMKRNLISVSKLVKSNLQFEFDESGFSIFRNKVMIDDYSRYGYVYLISEKSNALDMFKVYKAEVENQLDSKIKVVRSDRGGEFYGKFDERGRNPGPFAKFLQEDSKTLSCFFIGYPNRTKGYRFYCPNNSTRFMETQRAIFIEDEIESDTEENFDFDEILENKEPAEKENMLRDITILPFTVLNDKQVSPNHDLTTEVPQIALEDMQIDQQEPQPHNLELRRSQRTKRPALSNDFFVFLQESEHDINTTEDPLSYKQAIQSDNCDKWIEAMESELQSMRKNGVWKLVDLPQGCKPIGCKWVYKTKRNSKGQIDRYKARLVAKGFTQQEGVDYNETFSPVSTKDSLRVIMALVAHFDLDLHQMDVQTAFLNGNLIEEIYMKQPDGFIQKGEEDLVCRLQKSIYVLKQASRHWYLKFDEVVKSQGFIDNPLDECIYQKFQGRYYIFMLLYVDDILLASSNLSLLHDTKRMLSNHFQMTDLGEANYVLGIEISQDRERG